MDKPSNQIKMFFILADIVGLELPTTKNCDKKCLEKFVIDYLDENDK